MNKPIEIHADQDAAGERLDRFLAGRLVEISRSRVQGLIRDGAVELNGKPVLEPRQAVISGAIYRITIAPPQDHGPLGEEIPLAVVFEDDDLIVIDKPAGLVVHPAAGNWTGTLVNALIAHCGASLSGIGGERRPGIVHRLDKDTSGLMVVAKNDRAHASLSEQFAAHGSDGRLVRRYDAFVWGVPEPRRGQVDAPLARSASNRLKIAVARGRSGRQAVTHYEVMATYSGPLARRSERSGSVEPMVSLTSCRLETGRTHQIRVHMAHIRHPLLGDALYGAGFRSRERRLCPAVQTAIEALGRQALHAAELGFVHPASGRSMWFTSPFPDDLKRLHEALMTT